MIVHVVLAVQDTPDTRVDHCAETKEVICVLKVAPTKKQEARLLRKWVKDQDNDLADFWVEVVETKLL